MLPKVLLVHNRYLQAGGEETVFDTETSLLTEHGHKVITYAVGTEGFLRKSPAERLITQIWSRRAFHEVSQLIQTERPDVMHVHNLYPVLSPAIFYAARKHAVPVLQTLHNFRPLCPQGSFFRNGQSCYECLHKSVPWPAVVHNCCGSRQHSLAVTAALGAHALAGTLKDLVEMFIVPTEAVRDVYLSAGWSPEKLVVKAHPCHPDIGPGKSVDDREPFVLYAGRSNPSKGLQTAIEAWSNAELSSRCKLKVVGPGQTKLSTVASPNVEFLGECSRSQVLDLMGRATALVFPSAVFETFGMVAVEALARGTPVLCSDMAARGGIVRDNWNGLVFPAGDARGLAEKALLLLDRRDLRESLGASGRSDFERYYCGAVVYQQLLSIYKSVIARHGV